MGSLLEAVRRETHKGPVCAVVALRASLSKDLLADFDAAIPENSGYACTVLARELGKLGHSIPYAALQRHRRGECACRR